MRTALAAFAFVALSVTACSSNSGTGGQGGGSAGGGSAATGGGSAATGGGSGAAGGGSGLGGGGGGGGGSNTGGGTGATGGGGSHVDRDGGCGPTGPYGGGETAIVGGSATATILDQNGIPVAGQPLYICGLDICSSPAMTDAQGHASISTGLMMKRPAFKFGDAVTYAELGIPLTGGMNGFGTLVTAKLPTTGAPLTPGTSAISGGVTVALAADATVGIDELIYDTPDKQALKVAAIPVADASAVIGSVQVDGGQLANFGLLFGLSPADTLVCPRAKVTVAVPSTLHWAAGAAVEFWITTLDVGQDYAPYAGWVKVSDGTVSGDGLTASTSDGQGFSILDTFAVRLK